jgi:hypothetical protein
MRRCPGCAKTFRSGKRRGVIQEDGSVSVALVCGDCARRAFAVIRPIGDAAVLCASCKKVPARICSDCARRARAEMIAPVLMALHGMAKAARLQGQDENERAYEHAIRALEAEAEQG